MSLLPPYRRFAYHGTIQRRLPGICEYGLQPNQAWDPTYPGDAGSLFFAATFQHARLYGPIVLRFPWPVQWSSWTTARRASGAGGRLEYVTWEAVPPGRLEVCDNSDRLRCRWWRLVAYCSSREVAG